ncbi:MAG: NADH-quinone oxidoreductase subunit N [Deltaproteobacteria bacterium]
MQIFLLPILPQIILAGGGLLVYLTGIRRAEKSAAGFFLALLTLAVCAAVALADIPTTHTVMGTTAYGGFSRFFILLLSGVGFLSLLLIRHYAETRSFSSDVLYGTMLFAVLGMIGVAGAEHWLVFFLNFELLSFALYLLIAVGKSRVDNYEAAIKYFIMGAVASGFLLFGIALFYAATGSLTIAPLLAPVTRVTDSYLVTLATVLILAGIGFKISLVPFHLWTPDVYQGAPAPITGFLATGAKIAVIAFLLHLAAPHATPHPIFGPILWWLAALTILVGNITALVQRRVKRLLAYSSIAQMGYLLMAILAGRELGQQAVLFYSAAYVLMDLGAFGALTLFSGGDEDLDELDDFRQLGYRSPGRAALLAVSLLSLAGLPPTAGFIGKFLIFTAALKAGYIWLALIGIAGAVVSVFYYMKVVVALYLQSQRTTRETAALEWPAVAAGTVIVTLIFWLGSLPAPLLAVIDRISQALS